MKDTSTKVIGGLIAAGLLLNGLVAAINLFKGAPAMAQAARPAIMRVELCNSQGQPLLVALGDTPLSIPVQIENSYVHPVQVSR